MAGAGRPVGVPTRLGVLEGIVDGIEVNGTEAKQGGVWVRRRGEQVRGLLCWRWAGRGPWAKEAEFVVLEAPLGEGR